MKATENFKTIIKAYLDQRAEYDDLFRVSYTNPAKTLDECVTYILNEVQRSGCNGFADEEIFSMAMHYYDEPDIEIGKPIEGRVVVNHHVELTEEEKTQARIDAMKRIETEAYNKLLQQRDKAKRSVKAEVAPQATLFDNF